MIRFPLESNWFGNPTKKTYIRNIEFGFGESSEHVTKVLVILIVSLTDS